MSANGRRSSMWKKSFFEKRVTTSTTTTNRIDNSNCGRRLRPPFLFALRRRLRRPPTHELHEFRRPAFQRDQGSSQHVYADDRQDRAEHEVRRQAESEHFPERQIGDRMQQVEFVAPLSRR